MDMMGLLIKRVFSTRILFWILFVLSYNVTIGVPQRVSDPFFDSMFQKETIINLAFEDNPGFATSPTVHDYFVEIDDTPVEEEWLEKLRTLPQNVTSLKLSNLNIPAPCIEYLIDLPDLRRLTLSGCQLLASDWSEVLVSLPEGLELLDLDDTNIPVSGLEHLARFSNLKVLFASGLNLSESDWAHVLSLLPSSLRGLCISRTNVSGASLNLLSRLSCLVAFLCEENRLSDNATDSFLSGLSPDLRVLSLRGTEIPFSVLNYLYRYSKLEGLSLEGCRYSESDWSTLLGCLPSTLNMLNLSKSNVRLEGLMHLEKLPRLSGLSLLGCQLSSEEWSVGMRSLPNALVGLNLSLTNVSVSGLQQLNRLPRLCALYLAGCELSNEDWDIFMGSLPCTLFELNLLNTNYYGGCFEVFGVLKYLRELVIPIHLSNYMKKELRRNILEKYRDGRALELYINGSAFEFDIEEIKKEFSRSYGGIFKPDVVNGTADFSGYKYSPVQWRVKIDSLPSDLTGLILDHSNYRATSYTDFTKSKKFPCLKKFSANKCFLGPVNWIQLLSHLSESDDMEQFLMKGTNPDFDSIDVFKKFKKVKQLSIDFSDSKEDHLEELFDSLNFDVLETLEIQCASSDKDLFMGGLNLGNLKKLSITNSGLTEVTWMNIIRSLPNSIEDINLHSTDYFGECGEYFKKLPNLRRLNFKHCDILFPEWKVIKESVDSEVIVGYPPFQDNVPSGYAHYTQQIYNSAEWSEILASISKTVNNLSFHRSNYSGENLEVLSTFKDLKRLDLTYVEMSSEKWDQLFSVLPESLQYLDIDATNYSGEGIDNLKHCKNLKRISLYTRYLSKDAYDYLVSNPEELSHMKLLLMDREDYSNKIYTTEEWSDLVSKLDDDTCELLFNGSNYRGESIERVLSLDLKNLDLMGCDLTPECWCKIFFVEDE